MNKFYVYIMFRSNGLPFYVGKGSKSRLEDHFRPSQLRTNSYKNNIIKKTLAEIGDVPRVKISEGLSLEDANNLECLLISLIGRSDLKRGPLINLTDGGEGASNPPKRAPRTTPLSVREKQSASLRLTMADPIWRAKHIAIMNSPAVREKQRIAQKAVWCRPEIRERVSAIHRERSASPEYREKLRRAALIAQNRPEVKRKSAITNALEATKVRRSEASKKREALHRDGRASRDKQIIAFYLDGIDANEIAARCGCTVNIVYYTTKINGVVRRPPRNAVGRFVSRRSQDNG